MVYVVLGVTLFVVLVLIAVRIGIRRKDSDEAPVDTAVLSNSGVYSIVRRSPREAVVRTKPGLDEVRQYLETVNEDSTGRPLSSEDKERLIALFSADIEAAIAEVEAGDRENVEYYYYDYRWEDPLCRPVIAKGQYVSREEIYRFPQLIPPFHVGCGCVLKRHRPTETPRNTVAMHLRPLLAGGDQPPTIDWRTVGRLP